MVELTPSLSFACINIHGAAGLYFPSLAAASFPALSAGLHLRAIRGSVWMAVMRQGLLWLSERRGIFDFVRRNGLARKFASRFVAGETIEDGVAAARELSRRGITASLDLLGESVTVEAEAVAARDQYLRMLDRMAESGVEVNVSVKLTQMGLDIAEDLCEANMVRILEKAAALQGFVRLDMEGSDYTQRTLDFLLLLSLLVCCTCPIFRTEMVDSSPTLNPRSSESLA